MDPISMASALSSASGMMGGSASAMGGVGAPTALVQQAGGQTFTFQLPQAPTMGSEAATSATSSISALGGGEPTTFGHLAQQMVRDVSSYQQTAGAKVRDVLSGSGTTSVSDAMIAEEEAGISFKVLASARDKVVESYKQIMSMQI